MADKSKIEWTEATWQPVRGCSRVSPGCDNCYAIRSTRRGHKTWAKGLTVYRRGRLDWAGVARPEPHELDKPLRWRRPRKIFVCSQSDLFHHRVPFDYIAAVFAVMANCPQHVFQVLTKRPERMLKFLTQWCEQAFRVGRMKEAAAKYGVDLDFPPNPDEIRDGMVCKYDMSSRWPWPLPNVWLGVSVEDRKRIDRLDQLRRCPAAVRFLSLEPLLEDLGEMDFGGIHWCIVGGESGPKARPFNMAWAREILRQCRAHDVSFFLKQAGKHAAEGDKELELSNAKGSEMADWPKDLRVREFPTRRSHRHLHDLSPRYTGTEVRP